MMTAPATRNWYAFFAFLIFSAFIIFQIDVAFDLTDTFHEGEYVGLVWHMLDYYSGVVPFPLVIHGGLDFIPSLIAKTIFGESSIIVGTRIINCLITLVTWTFFLDFCRRLINSKENNSFLMAVPLLFIFLASKSSVTALQLHQAFMGPRDFFVICSLWAFIAYDQCVDRRYKNWCIALLFFSSVAGLYWSYDRGIMAAVVGVSFVASLTYHKKKKDLVLSAIALLIVLAVLEYTRVAGSIVDVLSNIVFWINNAKEIWSNPVLYPISLQPLMLPLSLLTLVPLLVISARNEIRTKNRLEVATVLIAALIVIEVLMIKTIFNRPGLPRTSWGLWPFIPLFAYGISRVHNLGAWTEFDRNKRFGLSTRASQVFAFAPALALSLTFSNYFYAYPNFSAFTSFSANIASPRLDIELISSPLKEVASELASLHAGCVLSWTNEGVIGMLARLPLCTKFDYAVYAATASQSTLIAQLSASDPQAIIFGSPSLAQAIDGRSMEKRLPEVYRYISNNYPIQMQVGPYTIRVKNAETRKAYTYQKLNFSMQSPDHVYLREGWSEPENWGTWSIAQHAAIVFTLPQSPVDSDYDVIIKAKGFVVKSKHDKQRVDVSANKVPIGSMIYNNPNPVATSLKISKEMIREIKKKDGLLTLDFNSSDSISPADLGLGQDPRKLGLGLISIQIKPLSIAGLKVR